jgi:hypothetical protein
MLLMNRQTARENAQKSLKDLLKYFNLGKKETFEANNLISTMDDIRTNMYTIIGLVVPGIDINNINSKCKEYGINLTLKDYCDSFSTFSNIDAYIALQDLFNNYHMFYLYSTDNDALYEFFQIFLFICNKNLNINNINRYDLANSTDKINTLKLSINKDFETSSKIKLYIDTDKNSNKNELDVSNLRSHDFDSKTVINKKCLIDNLCYKDLVPNKIFGASNEQKDACRKMLEAWIVFSIGKRFYLLNHTTFDFIKFNKTLADETNPLINKIKPMFPFAINYIQYGYDNPETVFGSQPQFITLSTRTTKV